MKWKYPRNLLLWPKSLANISSQAQIHAFRFRFCLVALENNSFPKLRDKIRNRKPANFNASNNTLIHVNILWMEIEIVCCVKSL